jgi:hypothetical protein
MLKRYRMVVSNCRFNQVDDEVTLAYDTLSATGPMDSRRGGWQRSRTVSPPSFGYTADGL